MNATMRRYLREPGGSASRALRMAYHYVRTARRYRSRRRHAAVTAAWYALWAVKKVFCGVS